MLKQDILRLFVKNLFIMFICSSKPTKFRKCLLFQSSGAEDTSRMPLSYNVVHCIVPVFLGNSYKLKTKQYIVFRDVLFHPCGSVTVINNTFKDLRLKMLLE